MYVCSLYSLVMFVSTDVCLYIYIGINKVFIEVNNTFYFVLSVSVKFGKQI